MMGGTVDILMYHSIAEAPGPTSIAPELFEAQMMALATSGLPVLRMDDVPAHLSGGQGRAVAITFDDGFRDFAEVAWPVLRRLDLSAMVYLPTDCMDGTERWDGAHDPPRPLMTWNEVRQLASDGVDFGNHTATHSDLSALDEAAIANELGTADARMQRELGRRPLHCAPPYGRSSDAARRIMARDRLTSVGTRLATAGPSSDLHDLPRLEMYYFTNLIRWRAHLEGRGGLYLQLRRAFRQIRSQIS
ncbi:polysaccharide deacetylase family protein [Aliiroseovarius sp.]|uniref:polysaccharide deacetylase family protein n=1 Tax=Aliiroseovarius sp. TaxID=1872442 RepID=UPI0026355341|nr:polysaccharide deacetylase family protein [Aliiroseovarius sp.]